MSDTPYAVIFQGRTVEGADPDQVRANMAKLFNADAARIEKMFSGQKVVIKKGLDAAGAKKYRAALTKAGAAVEIIDLEKKTAAKAAPAKDEAAEATPPPESAAAPATGADAGDAAGAAQAEAPDETADGGPSAPPQTVPEAYADAENPPDALESSLAEAGAILVEHERVAEPDIATDHLSMAEAGATLVEAEAVPEPEFDLSAMTLDPPGTTIVEHEPLAPPEFDFDGMSLEDNPS